MKGLFLVPFCSICRQPLDNAVEMHEHLTRGDVQGLPFDCRVQIFVAQNIVLLHQPCHKLAQWTIRGKRIVARELLRWNGQQAIRDFLTAMRDVYGSSAAGEEIRRLEEWKLLKKRKITT